MNYYAQQNKITPSSLGVDSSSQQSSLSLEGSPSPVMDTTSSSEVDSEPQLCQVSSPAPYPVKYVYPKPSTTFVTPSHKVSASMSGDNTGDDSGYGCSGDGQGYLSYVPSRESLASE